MRVGGFGPVDVNYIRVYEQGVVEVVAQHHPPVNRSLQMTSSVDTENIGLTARKIHTNVTSRR